MTEHEGTAPACTGNVRWFADMTYMKVHITKKEAGEESRRPNPYCKKNNILGL